MTSFARQSAVGSRQSERSDAGEIQSYRDLRVWNLSIELAVACYERTGNFPQSELYGLTSQMRRSATSIAAKIAEGYGRDGKGSYLQFLRVAQGSLKELETHVVIAGRIGYLDRNAENDLLQRTDDVGKMLRALIRGLERTP